MGEEMGLAQTMANQGSGVPGGNQMPTPEEVASLLAQGITPEELQAAGIPLQLIEAAMALLQQSQAPQQGPTMEPGLASAMAAPQGM